MGHEKPKVMPHEFRETVDLLTLIARHGSSYQQLRARISRALSSLVEPDHGLLLKQENPVKGSASELFEDPALSRGNLNRILTQIHLITGGSMSEEIRVLRRHVNGSTPQKQ